MIFEREVSFRHIFIFEVILIVLFATYKLFASHIQYDINVFLEWEGAYRLSTGQVPYRDFGMPVGYMFWIVPALFFKIFGPDVYTLIISQAFINLISGFIFWGILKSLKIHPVIRAAAVLIFGLSFTMNNHWPWYNHSVFVFELAGLYFIINGILINTRHKKTYLYIILGALFMAFAMLTKQDVGGLGLIFAFLLVLYGSLVEKHMLPVIVFSASYTFFLALLILPFFQYEFSYWYNYGQFPHYDRANWFDIVNEFFGQSVMIKLYLLFVIVTIFSKLNTNNFKVLWNNKSEMLFFLLTVGILVQAAIVQVTSYVPADGNIYFHSFAFAYIFSNINLNIRYEKAYVAIALLFFAGLWWSEKPWRMVQGKFKSFLPSGTPEDAVSKNTFIVNAGEVESKMDWEPSKVNVFKRIKLPQETNEGISRLLNLPVVKNNPDLKVLNMSELTPLAHTLEYELETGPDYPLWYHKGVAFFDREVEKFCNKIDAQAYDLILFEDIPQLNQFYPYEVRECIRENYKLEYKFFAPRNKPFLGWVEVYVKR